VQPDNAAAKADADAWARNVRRLLVMRERISRSVPPARVEGDNPSFSLEEQRPSKRTRRPRSFERDVAEVAEAES
jgi:hypothetical protein